MHIHIYISLYLSHMHILYRAWSKCVRGCSQHLSNVHICTCMVLNNTCECSCMCTYANGAAASWSWKLLRTYLESCANIVQAVVSARPPAPSSSRQPSCSPVARHVRLRNPIKSTLAHDAVAAVVRTSVIWSSALVRASSSLSMVHTRAWPRISPSTKIYFRCHFRGVFLVWGNLSLYHLCKCLLTLCHNLFVRKDNTKY